jgi:hypothetical protein
VTEPKLFSFVSPLDEAHSPDGQDDKAISQKRAGCSLLF